MRIAIAVLAMAMTGCATMDAAMHGIPPAFSESWGCDGENTNTGRMMTLEEQRAERRGPYLPQVGWNACRVLAELGVPRDIDRRQSAYGRSATWWYGGGSNLLMVTLEERSGRWIVDYVGS